jgi:flagellar motor switch protein FliN/FliY
MSGPANGDTPGAENARLVLDKWAEGLAQVLESMADEKPAISWSQAAGPPYEGLVWWEQPFQTAPDLTVWVGAPPATWEHVGTLTLKAAGLEGIESGEARNTWFEILGQSLGVMARSIGSVVGSEVTCTPGLEHAPGSDCDWYSVRLSFPDNVTAPLWIAARPPLETVLLGVQPQPGPAETGLRETAARDPDAAGGPPPRSRTMDLLLDVDLPVSISFGKAQLPMKDVLKLTTGSIVELNRGVDDPVEVLVNHCLIARGEVVVVDGNYGVRIQEFIFSLAVSAAGLAAAASGLLLLWHAVALTRRAANRQVAVPAEWEATVRALQESIDCLAARVEEAEHRSATAAPPLPKSGLNLSKRSQALRMYRRGDSPERIAATLEIPRQEVELLLKVHRIVLSSF